MPVIVGTTLALSQGASLNWIKFSLALICAALIQAGTNLINDVEDAVRGNDGSQRNGPLRVTSQGLASPAQVYRCAILVFAVAVAVGAILVAISGWLILIAGVLSIAAGWAYSAGSRPLSHSAFGELVVIIFFGIVAVCGSYYLQIGRISADSLVVGIVLGCPAAAVLLVNNLRDLETDQLAGRATLASVIGINTSYGLYTTLVLTPYLLLTVWDRSIWPGLAWIAFVPGMILAIRFCKLPIGTPLNKHLANTVLYHMLFGLLLSISWLI